MSSQTNQETEKKARFITVLPVVAGTSLLLFWAAGYLMIPVDDWMYSRICGLDVSETVMDMLWMSYYLCSYAVPMAACGIYIFFTDREKLRTFSAKYRNNGAGSFLAGMVTGFCMNGLLVLLSVMTGKMTLSFSGLLVLPLLAVLAGGVVQCSCEEVLYRGYMYQYLKDRYGTATAVLAGSVTFMLGHFGNLMYYGFRPAFMLNIVLLGTVFALLMRRTGSFWFACGVHTMWNFTQQYLFGLPNSGMVSLGAVFAGKAESDSFFFDSTFGIEGSWGCVAVLSLITVLLLIRERKRPVSF